MSNLSDRVSYLKGLAEGMEIAEDGKTGKLIMAIIDALGETAEAIQHLVDEHEELDEYVESIDDDLAEIEEALFDDDDGYDDDDDDDDDDDLIECECPHCHDTIYFDVEQFDLSEDHDCPSCGKPLFDSDEEPEEDGDKDDEP
ncbi:hypothetical protein LJC74_06290 [Eubacteriales bacterium OttesenSCG-928-A19]|nr:hypothetical protein [Eubacteriales bacterium OttesenSCG-928-A19]